MRFNTIKLKKYTDIIEEYVAAATIKPGQLLKLTSDGKVKPHNDASGTAAVLIALEDELRGRSILDSYSAGDPVQVWVATPGEMAYCILKSNQSAPIGTYLESAGDGELQIAEEVSSGATGTGPDHHIIGQVVATANTEELSTGEWGTELPYAKFVIVRIV